MKFKRDYIQIENLNQFLIKELKHYHPDDPRHTPYWSSLKRKCIEGVWGREFGGFRYMPGRLFFYGNFGTILDVDEQQNIRSKVKPLIRDIEWERAYMLLEADGFSGWSDDDIYTSDEWALELQKTGLPDSLKIDKWKKERKNRFFSLINHEGKLKKYLSPRDNIKKIHDKERGVPLYWNPTRNISELGARGGGKSYFYSIAVILHTLIFDGIKYYTQENIDNPPKAELCVGSGQAGKSSDFCKKIEDAMTHLAIDNSLGVWGKFGDEDYEPSIFYKEMAGTLGPNNKAKNSMWRHEYTVMSNGREVIKGTGSYVAHVVYSPNKPDGAEAAAGGRYNYIVYEEQGLTPLLIKAWGSNKSTVAVGARQFGVQIALGTSGNMDTVQPAKEVFTHPREFNLVTFVDTWEESGEIGFFLPAYMTASDFKDENGNTNYEEAITFYLKQREIAEASNNPHILAIEKMNNPLVPSDMWQSNTGNILPVAEGQARERGLLNNRLYEKNYTPIKLLWDSDKPRGVDYEVDKSKKPFFEHKYRYEREDLDGPIMIYEFPQEIHGVVPNDMYKFIGHDPYVSDNMDEGDSLGATYIIMNPKYATQGFSGNCIVASYIGKPHGGRKEYYQNLEKLLAFYGNPIRGLWFEANRGDECKNYFVNRDKQHLLALRPQNINSASIYQRKITQYGYIVGQSSIQKADLIDKVHDWLLEPTTIGSETLLNIERIPDLFLIRQIIAFDMRTGNYDAVMALAGAILGIKEEERTIIDEIKNKHKHNPLTFLSQNSRLFNNADPLNSIEKKIQALQVEEELKPLMWKNEWDYIPTQQWSKKHK